MAIIFTDNLTQDDTGEENRTIRVSMTPLIDADALDEFRLNLVGHAALNSKVSKVTVARAAPGASQVPLATPTEVLFTGASAGSRPAFGVSGLLSDWMPIAGSGIENMTTSEELLVSIVFGATLGNLRMMSSGGGGVGLAAVWKAGDQGLSMVGTGWTFIFFGSYGVDLVETQEFIPPPPPGVFGWRSRVQLGH